jgi:sugar-specific transcriptional regulator TrmB
MKKALLLLSIVTIASCTQSLEPTTENINSIFQSNDFTIEFILESDRRESMSFIEDYIVYKAAEGVRRRTITYDEALLINDFIQNQFQLHKDSNSETPAIVILNTAKKVTLKIPNYKMDYRNLINKLDL